ncbi:MAG: BRcat domain-containing protein [Rhodomicrobium sp.]
MADIGTLRIILQGVGTAREIAQLLGLIESANVKLDKLIQVNLNAGMTNLRDAADSDSGEERITLLREARNNLQKAVHLENGSRKAIALLGLSCCHAWLGDKRNSLKSLNNILEINPIKTYRVIGKAINAAYKDDAPTTSLRETLVIFVPIIITLLIIANQFPATNPRVWLIIGFPVIILVKLYLNLRRRYKKHSAESVDTESDGRAIKEIQLLVSGYLDKPVPWLTALDEQAILSCPNPDCSQKLRVPAGKSGQIRCPGCGQKFEATS